MARVAVLHNTLDFQGGADAVCLETCEALQADHDLTLYTVSATDLEELAARFDVDLDGVTVRMPPGASGIARTLNGLTPWTGPQLAGRSVLLHRFVRHRAHEYDLLVSTANEMALPVRSVQYVHYPQFNLHRLPDADAGRLNRLWSRLAGPDPVTVEGSVTLLANSAWTADQVERIYGTRPTVHYPPVDPIPCDRAWEERDLGVVSIGRIAPDKRHLEAIRVIDAVRDRGYDVHLHIAGSAPDAYRRYVRTVRRAAGTRPHVHLEIDVSRTRIQELCCTHRFGLNMKEREPFGMAVAEYVAAGMLAFGPAAGGQREILDGDAGRTFESTDEAVEKMTGAIEDGDPPTAARDRFGSDRFRTLFRQHVNRSID